MNSTPSPLPREREATTYLPVSSLLEGLAQIPDVHSVVQEQSRYDRGSISYRSRVGSIKEITFTLDKCTGRVELDITHGVLSRLPLHCRKTIEALEQRVRKEGHPFYLDFKSYTQSSTQPRS